MTQEATLEGEVVSREDVTAPAQEPGASAGPVVDVAASASPAPRHAVTAYRSEAVTVAPWEPSPLALMSEDDFELRLTLAVRERQRIAKIQKAVMTDGVDYGVIPGTKKPTLYKPGAEILNKLAGLVPEHDVTREVGDGTTSPDIRYQVRTRLIGQDGRCWGEGMGSSSSWETKYRYRASDRTCPECGAAAIKKSTREPEWYCWNKPERGFNGCGSVFALDDPRIVDQETGRKENPDPHEADNTLLKMALKRSDVDATLRAHAASGIFTQDIEDQPRTGAPGRRDASAAPQGNGRGAPRPASAPSGRKATPSQVTLMRARAAKRAKELGLEEPDAGDTLLSDVLRGGSVERHEDTPAEDVDQVLRAVDGYTL